MAINNCCRIYLTGFILALAYDDLSNKKDATQSRNVASISDYYKADNAVDRNITTCMRTEVIGAANYYPDKTVWWRVDLGGVYNIYSVNILFKNYDGHESRQRGRFAGFSLYASYNGSMDNSSLCYKDGPQLPPLNFTTTCITYGRYVMFYNERLPGVIYPDGYLTYMVFTELCEVTVLGCKTSGVYGSKCEFPCPTNCRYNTCHIQNGLCYGCKAGWTGIRCAKACSEGWYGLDCEQQCSGHCRDSVVCNHVTGQCDGGCEAGWKGLFCDSECENGTYGYNCVNTCSGHCLIKASCNKQNGHCYGGCKPGYANKSCNKPCPVGYYGHHCKDTCSGHCINNTLCDPIDGICIDGCQDGYIGKQCNESCIEGYHGRNCSLVCPFNCKTCKPTDVKCMCNAGWMGTNCSIGCVWSYGEDCRYPCNKHCINQTCDRVNGSCLSGCDDGFHGEKCDQEIFMSQLSTLSAGFLGSAVTACLLIPSALVMVALWKKRLSISRKRNSAYAEIGNQKGGDSTYQELTVSGLNKR